MAHPQTCLSLLVCLALVAHGPIGLAISPKTIDGSNKNLANPVGEQANRLEISTHAFPQSASEQILEENNFSESVRGWSVFVDHDMDFRGDETESHCVDIPLIDSAVSLDSNGQIGLARKPFTSGKRTSAFFFINWKR